MLTTPDVEPSGISSLLRVMLFRQLRNRDIVGRAVQAPRFGSKSLTLEGNMGSTLQDFRFGLRLLGRSPAFALAVVLTLGLGIGLNSCIFNVFYTILVRDLPFREPGRLVAVWSTLPEKLQHVVSTKRNVASYPNFQDWLAACYFPASRAARTDPMQTLKGE